MLYNFPSGNMNAEHKEFKKNALGQKFPKKYVF